MADIFISYAREDLLTAETLAQALIAHGWSVWWDRHIPAGRRFDEVIAEQLPGARCVLVLWSRNVARSEWVLEEAESARTSGALIPVMIEAVQPPMGFRRIHAADLIGWDGSVDHPGFKQLLIDMTNIVGKQRRRRAATDPQRMPKSALQPVPPEVGKSVSTRPVAWTGDLGPAGGEKESVAAADDRAVDLCAGASVSPTIEAEWDAAAIQAIENRLAHLIGPIAKMIVSRAMQDSAHLGSMCNVVARSIPLEADRAEFLVWANNLEHSRPLPPVISGANVTTPPSSFARGSYPGLLIPDELNLGEIEQALARHIGPMAKVILKRAMAQSGTRDEFCERLARHIEPEDERRHFRVAISRWI